MKNWKKLAEKMLRNMDRQKWIVCILIGVLLLVIAIPVDSKKQDAGTQESVQTTETESSSYVEQMERELEDLLGQMDGVGAVRVMITLEDQGENVVAQDISSQSFTTKEGETTKEEMSSDRTTVLSQDAPYETKTIEPKIRGVCVVAEGASDNRTKVAIYEAIQALFSVDAHKISIVEMGSQEGT